ncbi:MAG: tetratricopeptide repeat protein [Bacteroidetes bacterium]|nr:tetratricopeptide repeat protein [Bacteroidota bacterium]
MEHPEFALRAFSEAEQFFAQGDYTGAISRMEQSLNEFKGDVLEADALNNLGYYHLHLANWDKAIKYFEKAFLIDPTFQVILCHLAWAALMIQNIEGALALMELFEKSDTEYRAMHNRNKAFYYTLAKAQKEALKYLGMAEEEDPYLEYLDILFQANGQETESRIYPETDKQLIYLATLLENN